VRRPRPPRVPLWQAALFGLWRAGAALVAPLGRMWRSPEPIDGYGLVHLASVGGDALLAIALADSLFFSLPVDESRLRIAVYLGLTVAPLALAGPLIVPVLDRAGPRRAVSLAAAAARAVLALVLAPRLGSAALFPLALAILVGSKVHAITKNGLTMAYAGREEGLMRANARLGRIAVAGVALVAPFGYIALSIWGGPGPIYLAAGAWGAAALLTLRLPRAGRSGAPPRPIGRRGRVGTLTGPAIAAVGLRAASGFLLFLLAFALRTAEVSPSGFGLVAGAAVVGGLLADLVAPRVPIGTREEAVVVACVSAGCVGALVAWWLFALPLVTLYALLAGAATEFGRLAFQSLMQRAAPAGALGRVFVRYEVAFQLAWVLGAFAPTLLPIGFRPGIGMLAAFYGVLGLLYAWRLGRRGLPAPRSDLGPPR
jgi:hypothetical protein